MFATTGGKIRVLRKQRRETIENIAVDALVTYKTLCEIETGATKRPDRQTLKRILQALHEVETLSLNDWIDIYEGFGYKAPVLLPNEKEILKACTYWETYFSHLPFPAYLIDIQENVLAGNRFAPYLLGLSHNDPRIKGFQNKTTIDFAFVLYQSYIEIANRDYFLQNFVHAIKRRLLPYREEPWATDLVRKNCALYSEFKQLWDDLPEDVPPPNKPAIISLLVPGLEQLSFHLGVLVFDDPRFFIAEWTPTDDYTSMICREWAKEPVTAGR